MTDRRHLSLRAISSRAFRILVDCFRRVSVTFLLSGLLITYLAKMSWHIDTISKAGSTRMGFLAFFAEDLLFIGIAVVAALAAEWFFRGKVVRAITGTLAALVSLGCALNAAWLGETGYQLTASIFEIGLTRFEELEPIFKYEMGIAEALLIAGTMLLPAALALLFHKKAIKNGLPPRDVLAFTLPALLLLLSVFGHIQRRNPDLLGWRMIADNLYISIAADLAESEEFSALPSPESPVSDAEIARFAKGDRPNVLIVFLESVSHRASSLSERASTTPFLEQFAQKGLEARSMRVVVPHSTKTLCATLCGRTPGLQQSIVESADDYPHECLPSVFARAGYDTAYMQASKGWFEDLPRLTHGLGFGDFIHYHNIEPEPQLLGYLGADDAVLELAALRWIDEREGPFFLALFTSSTHHPYVLPRRLAPLPEGLSVRQQQLLGYSILVSETDRIVSNIVRGLEERGLADDTIIVLMGDHGESFGDHGQFQHDNIFTEEGVKIPFAINAPGVAPGTVVEENRTVLDIAPTILDLAGLNQRAGALEGTSLLKSVPADKTQRFACFYDNACVGMIKGDTKTVLLPNVDSWLVFDLKNDPKEQRPEMEGATEEEEMEALRSWYRKHRYREEDLTWSERSLYGGAWQCDEGYGKCTGKKRAKQTK